MSILPVHQMIETPNFLATGIAAQQAGQQNRMRSQAMVDQQALRGLAPNILAGDPDAYQQAAAIDPQAAGQYQEAGDAQLRRLKGFVQYIDEARASGDVNRLNGALRSAGPYLAPMLGGRAPPTEWAPDMDAGWEALKARIAGAEQTSASAMPTGFREIDMKLRAAGYQPGSEEYKEGMRIATGQQGRAATGGFGFQMIRGADGVERPGRQNPRTGAIEIYDERSGEFMPIGSGGALNGGPPAQSNAAGGMVATPGGGQAYIEPGLSPDQLAAAQADIAANGSSDSYRLPARNVAPSQFNAGGGNAATLAVGRTPEQQAALTAQATQAVELAGLPARQQIETQGAVDRTVGTERAKAGVESARELPKIQASAQQMRSVIQQLLEHPGLDTATGLGSINPLNRVPGTEGYNVRVLADQLQGQTFLQAFESLKGGGPITDVEGQKATDAIARLNRGQSTAEYRKALNELLGVVNSVEERARRSAARGAAASNVSGGAPPATDGRTVTRRGTMNGRRVVQYSDGSVEYGD